MDPAFFMRSEWDYQGLYHNKSTSISQWNGQTYWGWEGSSSRGWFGISGGNSHFQGQTWHFNDTASLRFYTYAETNGFGVFGSATEGNAQKWGAEIHKNWRTISGVLRGAYSRNESHSWMLSHSGFPEDNPELFGTWRNRQKSVLAGFQAHQQEWGISSSLIGVITSPSRSTLPYCIIDSSIWILGNLEGYIDAGPTTLTAHLLSISGNTSLRGYRQDSSYSRLIAQASSGLDDNAIQLEIAPKGFRQPVQNDPQWKQLDAPYSELPIPHLTPTTRHLSGQFHFRRIQGNVFEPPQTGQTESLWGNRLFAPDINGIYGFSFYRKNFAAWGNGTLNICHAETTIPFSGKSLRPWIALGMDYWRFYGNTFFRERTSVFITEQEKLTKDSWVATSHFGLVGFGAIWQAPKQFPLYVKAAIQQFIPFSTSIEKNGASVIPQKSLKNGKNFTLLRNGFSANLSLEWKLN